jgi:toxin ParE1/3/4
MKLQISPEAQSDLQSIKEYIAVELDNPSAALSTVSRITKAIRTLSDFPASGALLSSVVAMQTNYRFLVSGNYLVFYRYEGDNIHVVRVLYGRRDYMTILFGKPKED